MSIGAVSFRSAIPNYGSPTFAAKQAAQVHDLLLAVLTGEPSPFYPPGDPIFATIPVGGAGYTILRHVGDHAQPIAATAGTSLTTIGAPIRELLVPSPIFHPDDTGKFITLTGWTGGTDGTFQIITVVSSTQVQYSNAAGVYAAAGGTFALEDDFRRGTVLSWPMLDRNDSFAHMSYIGNQQLSFGGGNSVIGNFWVYRIFDIDLFAAWRAMFTQTGVGAKTGQIVSLGSWDDGAGASDPALWPSAGRPRYVVAGNQSALGPDERPVGVLILVGDDLYEAYVVASAYGWVCALTSSTPLNNYLTGEGAEFDFLRLQREIKIVGNNTGNWPIVAPAPAVGATGAHLRVEVEGQPILINFDNRGLATLNSFDFAQAISMQGDGRIEGEELDVLLPLAPGNDIKPVVRIPPDRVPAGEWSMTPPALAITHADPSLLAAGIDFTLFNGTVPVIATGPLGYLERTGIDWIPLGPKPRRYLFSGSVVYNVNLDDYAEVVGFSGAANDQLVLDNIPAAGPGTWTIAHTYYVLPGPVDHAQGVGAHSGQYQATPSASMALDGDQLITKISNGGDIYVELNDLLGEAVNHFEIGQEVGFANNGLMSVVEVDTDTPVIIGDRVRITSGIGLGSEGYVRWIEPITPRLVINWKKGPNGILNPYKGPPIGVGSTLLKLDPLGGYPYVAIGLPITVTALGGAGVGVPAPSPMITNPPALGTQVGQFGRARIRDVIPTTSGSQRRTTLRLDFTAATVNANVVLFPGFLIGVRPKTRVFTYHGYNTNLQIHSITPSVDDVFPSFIAVIADQDVNTVRRYLQTLSTTQSPRDPDHQVQSLGAEATIVKGRAYGSNAHDWVGSLPHYMTVSSRKSALVPNQFDTLLEDGDPSREWLPIETMNTVGLPFGAAVTGSTLIFFCIGPGTNIQY